ncbi:unnamed protein product [Euphydryas editha]|uniref:Uncharacterized protein n=1 Tax=Euphydryas editha TaxID=104508 RepID=A0AAU9TZI5_EUPED|nr:unnamed protein product [Euphydryas editha]
MCCYKSTGMCDLCREFQLSVLQNLLKTFPSAAPKIDSVKYLQDDISNSMYPPSPPEIKPSQAELANDLLQQLENQCKQGM